MLHYLKDHHKEVYPLLEEKGKIVRKGMKEALDQEGVDAVVTGMGSLFQTHFPLQKGRILGSPHSIHRFTDIEKREVEFRIRMLTKGIHVMHGGGGLSITHSDEDIEKIIEATRDVGKEMREDRNP
jgi:glutamate-1-semialdehyde 2,1-aminomutase